MGEGLWGGEEAVWWGRGCGKGAGLEMGAWPLEIGRGCSSGGVAFVVGVAPRGGRVPMKGAGLRVGGAPMWAGLRGGRGHPHLRGLNAINTHLGGAGNKETPKMGIPPLPPLQELGRTPKKGGGGGSGNEVTPKTRGTPPGNGETPKNGGHPSTSPKKWGDPPPKQVVEVHQELGGRGHNGGHPQEVGDPHGVGGKWGPP